MKTILIILLLLLQTAFVFSQESASQEIKFFIAELFNKWLKKSEFESNAEYEKRIKNESDEKLKLITDKVIEAIKKGYLRYRVAELGEYDAENEMFVIYIKDYDLYSGKKTKTSDTAYIKISRNIASNFKKTFGWFYDKSPYQPLVLVIPEEVTVINEQWKITQAIILFDNFWQPVSGNRGLLDLSGFKFINERAYEVDSYFGDKLERRDIIDIKTIQQPAGIIERKVYSYKWKLSEQPNYTQSSTKPISFTLEDLNITLPTININTQTASSTKPQVPDLNINSIQTKNKNPNAFAVVIGNKDYQYTKKVSFAVNDAQTMKNYLVNVLGYNEGNIFYLENASKSNFETYLGTKENPQGKLFNNIKQGISDVFIYYAGHGAPGLKDNKGYFVPIDCDPQYVEQGGYSLDLFYNNISKLNAKSITVVTDACFSGAEIFNNISPITITVSNPIAVADNCVVLSSSTGSQVSSWYNEKQHGMFTYFFLKALQDKDKSDKNKDGKLSFQEIFDYVSDKTEGVPYYARSIHGVDQTPAIQGTGKENVFIEYK